MKKQLSLFHKLVVTLILLATLICLVFLGTIFGSQAITGMKDNSFTLFDQRVEYRKNEMQKLMTSFLLETNSLENASKQANIIYNSRATKNDDFITSDLLHEITELSQLTNVTGAYVILDKDVFHTASYPTIYLRDNAPDEYFPDNSDVIAKYGKADIIKKMNITLDQSWKPTLNLTKDKPLYNFYTKPFEAAKKDSINDPLKYAYWGSTIRLPEDDHNIITYSMPLISEDKQVYGVIGIDYDIEYLQRFLTYNELQGNGSHAYTLVKKENDTQSQVLFENGPALSSLLPTNSSIKMEKQKYGYEIFHDKDLIASSHSLLLYDTYSVFENEVWSLVGITQEKALFATSNAIQTALIYAFIAALCISVLVASYASLRFTRPIAKLTKLLRAVHSDSDVNLPPTNILEIDELSSSIEMLSRNLSNAESRLSSIMQTLDMPIGAIEIYGRKSVYCSEKVGKLMRLPNPEKMNYTYDEFIVLMKDFQQATIHVEESTKCIDGKEIKIDLSKFKNTMENCWLRFMTSKIDDTINVIIIDVTAEITEKENLVYERDHDVLTGLLNRRAFRTSVRDIMEHDTCEEAAMVLWDLDNLKLVNDTYGHDAGDLLICSIANMLQDEADEYCIVARMAGDEFLLFYHHCVSRDAIYARIEELHRNINRQTITFGEYVVRQRVSAGIAWYKKEETTYEDLKKHSDYAMYEVKNSQKGGIKQFNATNYHKNSLLFNGRQELNELLENRHVKYAFQPIVSALDGSVFAYEALMRPQGKLLTSPADVMRLARAQSQLYQVEYLTWTKALEEFKKLDHGKKEKANLFLNSIPSIPLLDDLKEELVTSFADILPRLVIELLETDEIEQKYLQTKRDFASTWKAHIAIDDFGSGYNGDHALLNITANFIKIDMEFIQGIAEDTTRQTLVKNMIQFAHDQAIKVIAEGVETSEDMQYLIAHGVDYLQGYYIGRPMYSLQDITEEIQKEIQQCQEK